MLRWRSLHALVLALWTGCSLSAQLVVGTALTPAQVVQGVLLGPGVTASNIQFLGDPDQLGTFIGVNSNIGLDSGMVMCTGDINVAPGPNMQGGATLGGGNQTGDPDLDAIIAPYFSRDRAVLEFDFIATGDSVRFTFIFASEEYNEYVCTAKNDVFGFFLSGPGINGPFLNNAENIALVPGTSVPVQINTVNIGAAGSAGGNPANCAAADPNWQANSVYFVDNANGATVEFDGFTVPLVAAAQVICGQQYHIKLAIADADDTVFDSAVFIEAGSFQSNAIDVSTQILAGGVDSVLYEGCGEAELILVRAGLLQTEDTVFLSTSGQAVAGTDYSAILSEVVFPVGVDSAIVPISALQDGLPEGIEQAIITAITQGDCGADTALIVFYVDDAPAIDILMAADTMVACPGDSALVQASVSGGFGMRQLSWNTGLAAGDNAAWVSPAQTTTYVLSVTDDCGQVTAVDSMTVTVPEPDPLVVTAIPDTLVFCPESPVLLEAVVEGGTPGFQYAWSNGLGNAPTAAVAPSVTATYGVNVIDACGQDTSDQVTVTVQYDTVQVTILSDTTICRGDTAWLQAVPELGWNGYQYTWSTTATSDLIGVTPVVNTIYDLVVTDGCGITSSDQVGVGVNAPLAAFSYTGSVYVSNFPIQFLDQSQGATSWNWDFGFPDLISDEQYPVVAYPGDGLFTVILAIEDVLGCVDTTTRTIFIDPEFQFYAPNAFTPDGDGVNDLFGGSGVGIDTYAMSIFNRWGELIYETSDPGKPWDGSVNGTECPQGVYVYVFRLRAIAGEVKEHRGHVTLLR